MRVPSTATPSPDCRKCFRCLAFLLFPVNILFPKFRKGLVLQMGRTPIRARDSRETGFLAEKINPSVTNWFDIVSHFSQPTSGWVMKGSHISCSCFFSWVQIGITGWKKRIGFPLMCEKRHSSLTVYLILYQPLINKYYMILHFNIATLII